MPKMPSWEAWEQQLQADLGLDSTICSGNQWNDQGDASDNTAPQDSSFRLLVDAKYTEKLSYSLALRNWHQWRAAAVELGKRPIIAVRYWARGVGVPTDVVVMDYDDFQELREKAALYDTGERLVREHLCGGRIPPDMIPSLEL